MCIYNNVPLIDTSVGVSIRVRLAETILSYSIIFVYKQAATTWFRLPEREPNEVRLIARY